MLHGQLPLRLMISAIAVRTSSRTIATVHKFHLQILVLSYFNPGGGFGQVHNM